MRPHPRIRRTIKWGGAAVTGFLVVVCAASLRRSLGWMFPHGYRVSAGWGTFELIRFSNGFPVPAYGEWHTDTSSTDGGWWYGEYRATLVWDLQLPAWVPLTVAFVITAIPWRLDALARRRVRVGCCLKCHYDRTGLAPGAACPECGEQQRQT